jgi:hypothetical protein
VPALGTDRWRVAQGEEARLTPEGPTAAEIVSQGFLPLRVRTPHQYRLRAPFPGTAVVLGETNFEVVEEAEAGDTVVYRLAPWPEGEVVRDRVVYGPRLVRAAEAERKRSRVRERLRPFRWLLYPLVGLLPEDEQERLSDRLGLYAVTATLVSGLGEAVSVLAALYIIVGSEEPARRTMAVLATPLLLTVALPGLGRAFGAVAFRESQGSWPVVLVFDIARFLGQTLHHDATLVPLTRDAFWERLALPDRVEREAEGSLLHTTTLPHLTWRARRLEAGNHYWLASVLPPALHRGRLLYAYRLTRLGDPLEVGQPEPGGPTPTAYADEVLAEIQREWDDLMTGFGWLVSCLPSRLQQRACDRHGGPPAIKRWTVGTAVVSMVLAVYLLFFLRGGPPGDPLAPFVFVVSLLLLGDGAYRLYRVSQNEYAPSLLRFVLPGDSLRPERLAFHAHRDAEHEALRAYAR